MPIAKIEKVGKVGSVSSVPRPPRKERKFKILKVEPKEDPVETYIEGTNPTRTIPERCVEAWLNKKEIYYMDQKRIYGLGVTFTRWGTVTVDFLVPRLEGKTNVVLRIMGEYFHKDPGRAYKDDVQARRLRALDYWVVDLWAEDILRAVRAGSLDKLIYDAVHNPVLM